MPCERDPDACRAQDIAEPLHLRPNPRRPGDWEGHCPECGHGGFALSKPTLTRMRHIWSCNCKICNGGNGCSPRAVRAAMLRRKIRLWCLGSYVGKDKPKHDLDRLLKIAQTVDDVINCCPALSAADMVMALADARGDKIPEDYGECAAFAEKHLGMSHGNAYNVARKWATNFPRSRPPGAGVPPQTGGVSQDSSRTTAERNRVNTAGQSPGNVQKLDSPPSKTWTEAALDEGSASPEAGQRAPDDKPDTPIKPAA